MIEYTNMLYAVCFSVYDFDEDGRLSTRDLFRALQLQLNESLPHDFAKLLKVVEHVEQLHVILSVAILLIFLEEFSGFFIVLLDSVVFIMGI